jgi:hypothetical protein
LFALNFKEKYVRRKSFLGKLKHMSHWGQIFKILKRKAIKPNKL